MICAKQNYIIYILTCVNFHLYHFIIISIVTETVKSANSMKCIQSFQDNVTMQIYNFETLQMIKINKPNELLQIIIILYPFPNYILNKAKKKY